MKIKIQNPSRSLSFKRKFYSFCFALKYNLQEYKWVVYNFFRSSQHWLIKQIPRNYQDKPELIPLLLFAILVDFVETEGGLNDIDYDWSKDLAAGYVSKEYVEHRRGFEKTLRDTYHYIKIDRPILQKQMEKMLETTADSRHYLAQEELCNEKDQEAMMNIVKYSKYLWT